VTLGLEVIVDRAIKQTSEIVPPVRPRSAQFAPSQLKVVGKMVGDRGGKISNLNEFNGLDKANGGRGGIRTHGGLAPTAVFKTAALNHSATLPVIR
jgi:hypothetical protein